MSLIAFKSTCTISVRKIATLIARKLHYEGLSEMGLRFPLFNLQGVPFEKQKLNEWHYNSAFTTSNLQRQNMFDSWLALQFSNGTNCKTFFLFTYLPFLASLLLWWKGLIWFVGRPLFSSIWRIFLLWGSNSHCDSLRALIWLWSPVEEDVSCKRPELSNVGIFLWLQKT